MYHKIFQIMYTEKTYQSSNAYIYPTYNVNACFCPNKKLLNKIYKQSVWSYL